MSAAQPLLAFGCDGASYAVRRVLYTILEDRRHRCQPAVLMVKMEEEGMERKNVHDLHEECYFTKYVKTDL